MNTEKVVEFPILIALAGGAGSRLAPVWSNKPKVLVPVAGRPYFDWFVEGMHRAGFRRFLFLLGFRADLVVEHISSHSLKAMVGYAIEDQPLGTGGALRRAFADIKDKRVFAANADSYCRIDYGAMLEDHIESGAACTMALARVEDTSSFGSVSLSTNRWVSGFVEKTGNKASGYVNAGVYLLERDCLDAFPAEAVSSIERDVFPVLANQGRMRGFHAEVGELIDIGTPERLQAAHSELARLSSKNEIK